MNIFALPGFKVKVTRMWAFYTYKVGNRIHKGYLELGKLYTVDRTEVHDYRTTLWLKEIPGVALDASHFTDHIAQNPVDDAKHPDWLRYNK